MTDHRSSLVCAKCGSDSISVDFETTGCGFAVIGVDTEGRPYVDHIEQRDYDVYGEEYTQFTCGGCDASWYPLEKGLVPRYSAGIDFEPGDRVMLADGSKATVATVDTNSNTFTVEAWHETFNAHEAHRLLPKQETF